MSTHKIVVDLRFHDNPDLPAHAKWVASIKEGQYKGTVVSSNGPAGCFREISTSMAVMDKFRAESKTR